MRTWSPVRRSRSITRWIRRFGGGRLFVHARTDPYALVPPITRIIRELSADQPVEKAATLDDVRAEVLAPNRLNALVFGGFAGVALLIAIVGVAGVLAFSVSARTREFGIRLAIGSEPKDLLGRVVKEGATIAAVGIVAGVVGGLALDASRRELHQRGEPARSRADAGRRARPRRRGAARVTRAGCARVARGRDRRAAAGVTATVGGSAFRPGGSRSPVRRPTATARTGSRRRTRTPRRTSRRC